jgi:plasmid stabilization system protein ParE
MQFTLHPAAERELGEALERSAAEFGPRVACRLRQRIEQLGEMLVLEPSLGTGTPSGARMLPLGRYPYSLVYRVEGETLLVLALMHQSRKPGYWIKRR